MRELSLLLIIVLMLGSSAGANYTAASVERDGLIITSDGPQAATKFAEEIAKALEESD